MGNVVLLRRPSPEAAGEPAACSSSPDDEAQALSLRTACAFAVLALGFGCTLTMPAVFAFAAFILLT